MYRIKLKKKMFSLILTFLQVTDGDITGVRLIVFRYYGQMDVSGNILTNQEYLQSLKVCINILAINVLY